MTVNGCPLQALGTQIVVLRDKEENVTAGGIVLPDQAKEKPRRGLVVSTGLGEWQNGVRIPLDVVVGDRVYFSHYAGTEVRTPDTGDTPYLVMEACDVLARYVPATTAGGQ